MRFLSNTVQRYAWGAPSGIPEILGQPVTGEPAAELWMGAHPVAPSQLLDADGQPVASLLEWVETAPEAALGKASIGAFGNRLPFLLKILAAETALSIQAHPSLDQARAGYARENAAGIPLDAPERNYKDDSHKPELIYALTEFHALCGFRRPEAITAMLDRFASALDAAGENTQLPALAAWRDALASGDLKQATGLLLRERDTYGSLADALAHIVIDPVAADDPSHAGSAVDPALTLREVQADFPHDPGVLVALMLNRLRLEPGQALALDAGILHAYLGGLGIEIMASSDNVLRGGLTSKHIDVDELDAVVTYTPGQPALATPDETGVLRGATDDFALQVIDTAEDREVHRAGPAILLCTSGTFTCSDGTRLQAGDSVFLAAEVPALTVNGSGRLFVATTGLPDQS